MPAARHINGLLVACLAAAMQLLAADAFAASRICRDLEAQLAADTGGGSTRAAARYDRAIARQKAELVRAMHNGRAQSCGFGLFAGPGCGRLNTTIARMKDNLAELERTRAGMGSRGAAANRARLRAALRANRCDRDDSPKIERVEEAPARRGTDGILRIPGPGAEGPSGSLDGRRYRTICVRTCDGYFFPISPSSGRLDFDRDEQNCRSSCPRGDVALYYQPAGQEDSATMTSWQTGQPYSALPTAYRYRDEASGGATGCGCQAPQRNFVILGGAATASAMVSGSGSFAIPEPRAPAPAEEVPSAPAAPEITELAPPGERRVRVVGPAFLPAPSAAEVPQAQDPIPAP